jgi:tripartite-type tricarboxylate transporter receptor subunit TctC
MRHATLLRLSALGACTLLAASLSAQPYPARPIRLIVPNAPGGGTDTIARSIADKVGPALGQPIVVENRAGGGGRIAAELVARSPKDGYTLLQGSNSALITGPAMYSKLSYDPIKDFAPISLAATTAYILAVHPSVPARSVKDVIVLAKTRKGGLAYGSTGPGSSAHLGMELLEAMTGIRLIHVPFKGSAPAMLSFIQGEIDIMFGNYQATLSLVRSGRLKALGQSSAQRSSLAPDIPTIAESGLPGFEIQQFYSLVAPAGTPGPIIQRLNQEVVRHLPSEDVRKRLSAEGIEITVSTPEEFGKLMASELVKWTRIIRAAGIKVD